MGETNKNQYKKIRSVLIIVLLLNWLVAALKITLGLLSNCFSIAADGLHSLSDGASNIIGMVGIYVAYRPKDAEHPYGHKKYETLFALGIAVSLFIVSFNLFKGSLLRIKHPAEPQVNALSFIVMFSTLIINAAVMLYENRKGKSLKSDVLISDSLHTRADIFTSISVIIALVVIKLGYPILDPIVGIIIAFFIAWAGYKVVKKSSDILCDSAIIVDVKKIVDIVLRIKGVKACHKIRTRGRPDDIYIDLHVQVSPDMHIDQAHDISYKIEDAIKSGIDGVTDVVVHIEPKEPG